jgi:lauroyl/myristoyl acyltransferase
VSDEELFEPDMFRGPKRLRPLEPLLRQLPRAWARDVLATLAVGDGFVRSSRLRRTLAWSRAQGRQGAAAWQLAFALLANHGRFVADEMLIGLASISDLARDVVVDGIEHLDGLTEGGILLGFHLGPPRTAFILRALGYPVRFAGRLEAARGDGRWSDAKRSRDVIALPSGVPRDRAEALHRIRTLVRNGAIVYLAADGPFGREAFRVELPGEPVIVRGGWLAIRQHTRVPTLPVFTHYEGGRRVIVIHAPLPPSLPNRTDDAAMCRDHLTPYLRDYAARFPEQCRYLALVRWPTKRDDGDR